MLWTSRSSFSFDTCLSYDVAVIQWITSCHKNCMTTRVITLWRVDVTSPTTSVSTMRFLIKILSILKAIKYIFKGSYDKQNLTRVAISYVSPTGFGLRMIYTNKTMIMKMIEYGTSFMSSCVCKYNIYNIYYNITKQHQAVSINLTGRCLNGKCTEQTI